MNTRVGAVILFYNKANLTLGCLRSVLNQTTAVDQILLVDNGSAPECLPQILSALTPAEKQQIQSIRIDLNAGFSKGMNAGLKECFEKFELDQTILISNDVELAPDFVSQFRQKFTTTPTLLCPQIYHLKNRKLAQTHGYLDIRNMELSHHHSLHEQAAVLEFPAYYPAAVTVWNRSAYDLLGGFDERFFCYWEDVALAWQAHLKNVVLRSDPLLKAFHLGRGTTGGKPQYFQHFLNGKNLMTQLLKNSELGHT